MRSGPTSLRVLLDISCLYNLAKAAGTLSDAGRRFCAEREARIYESAVSIREMRLKYRGRTRRALAQARSTRTPSSPRAGGRR